MKTTPAPLHHTVRPVLGALTLALLLACGSVPATAATVGYWRFESGNFYGDSSGNGQTLSAFTGTAGGVVPYTATTSGYGAAFPTVIPQTGAANTSAAQGSSTISATLSWGDRTLHTADTTALSTATSAITIEALVNLSSSVNNANRTIAAQGGNATNGGWSLLLTAANSGRGANDLLFQWQSTAGAWGSGGMVTLDSGIKLVTGNDYYIGFALNAADTASTGAIFYVKDLTAGTAMQVVSLTHTTTSIYDTGLDLTIGSCDAGLVNFAGTIDEVRISNTQLAYSDLLIVPEPKSWAMLLLAGAMLLGWQRRQRVSAQA